jgi:L-glyceraldehyde reductase
LVLVSKLWNNAHKPEDVEPQLDYCLKTLNTSYLDVYLIHWPVQFNRGEKLQSGVDTDPSFGIVQTWKEMVRVYKETKKVKAIGVSNFTVEHLKAIIEATGVVPAMNQIEAHPQLIQPELFQFCESIL